MGPHVADLTITSEDYEADGRVPDALSKEGGNETPRFSVSGVPADAVELALVVHDPDAPMARGFTHWVVYGLPLGRALAHVQYPPFLPQRRMEAGACV